MTIPAWEDCPDWANYLTQDEDGTWWCFAKKPTTRQDSDIGYWDEPYGESKQLNIVVTNWKDSLQERETFNFNPSELIKLDDLFGSLPKEIEYIALDKDGDLYGYTAEPIANLPMAQWVHKETTPAQLRGSMFIKHMPQVELSWADSLIKVSGPHGT